MNKNTFYALAALGFCAPLIMHSIPMPDLSYVQTPHDRAEAKRKATLDLAALRFMDGTPLVDIDMIMYFGAEMNALQNGADSKKLIDIHTRHAIALPHGAEVYQQQIDTQCATWKKNNPTGTTPTKECLKVGLIYHNGSFYSLKQLIAINKTTPFNAQEHHAIMDQLYYYFDVIARPHVEEVQQVSRYMQEVVKKWAEVRNRPDTILLKWSRIKPGNETQAMREYLTTLESFDIFLTDLMVLLADIVANCPKSYQQFVAKQKANKK